MASDRLFEALAEALGQPSKTYRAAKAGLEIPGKAMDGYSEGAKFSDSIRQRKLSQQTLGEALGDGDLDNLTAEQGALHLPTLKAKALLANARREREPKVPASMDGVLADMVNRGLITPEKAYEIKSKGMLAGRGYELGPDGELIQLPGGEPRRKTEKTEKAVQSVTDKLDSLKSLYEKLDESKGIVSTDRGTLENLGSSLAASAPGQFVGKITGSGDQSLRNQIATLRPLIINDIRQASEMGARGLDSEKELEFYLRAASAPQVDVQANMAAIENLKRAYGKWQAEVAALDKKGPPTGRKTYQKTATNAQGIKIGTNDNWATFEPVQQ